MGPNRSRSWPRSSLATGGPPLPKGRPQEIIRMVDNITDLNDIKKLMDLLVVERSVALQYAG